jgi:hypothetical protein
MSERSPTERFFAYARERYWIKLRRDQGLPAPWTTDPILQQYRFCNVFRADDRPRSSCRACCDLLELSRDNRHWPQGWPRWEMRDVEHTLCEADKYWRAESGNGRLKQHFRPAA